MDNNSGWIVYAVCICEADQNIRPVLLGGCQALIYECYECIENSRCLLLVCLQGYALTLQGTA